MIRARLTARMRRALQVVIALVLLLSAGLAAHELRVRRAVAGWTERAQPVEPQAMPLSRVRAGFERPRPPDAADYDALALHLLEGWTAYRTPDAERAHYPGEPSDAGRPQDGLEGFARILPLAAVRWARGSPPVIATLNDTRSADLVALFAQGLKVGTNPAHPNYWGTIRDYSPQLVEAADIALGLWIGRAQLWDGLDAATRQQVSDWLIGALTSQPHEGNWQLFPLIVHRALQGLEVDVRRFDARMTSNWEHFRSLHRGNGWFDDPPNGFDYYNAWGVHYGLYWLRRMDPHFEPAFIGQVQGAFADFQRHLFSQRGHPLMGRSVCYRMAAPTPLLAAQFTAPGAVASGEALRALDLTWSWFLSQGAIKAGAPTSGFCGDDPALQARYSGPASCLWSLRALVLALDLQAHHGLLDQPRAPLPVERGNFTVHQPVSGWTILGEQATQRIELVLPAQTDTPDTRWRDYGWAARMTEAWLHSPRRPDNHPALYLRHRYPNGEARTLCER
jgi:hypothetical protein